MPGAELREIQKQIDSLPNSTDPGAVAEFMSLRRDVMFLEFDTAVRHCMADTFLSTGNIQAYKVGWVNFETQLNTSNPYSSFMYHFLLYYWQKFIKTFCQHHKNYCTRFLRNRIGKLRAKKIPNFKSNYWLDVTPYRCKWKKVTLKAAQSISSYWTISLLPTYVFSL